MEGKARYTLRYWYCRVAHWVWVIPVWGRCGGITGTPEGFDETDYDCLRCGRRYTRRCETDAHGKRKWSTRYYGQFDLNQTGNTGETG